MTCRCVGPEIRPLEASRRVVQPIRSRSRRTGNAERRLWSRGLSGKEEKGRKKKGRPWWTEGGNRPLECPLSQPPPPTPASTLSTATSPVLRPVFGPFTCVECTSCLWYLFVSPVFFFLFLFLFFFLFLVFFR